MLRVRIPDVDVPLPYAALLLPDDDVLQRGLPAILANQRGAADFVNDIAGRMSLNRLELAGRDIQSRDGRFPEALDRLPPGDEIRPRRQNARVHGVHPVERVV